MSPTVHTYGLASPGAIDGEATIAENDAVNVGAGAFVQAQGNLNLIAGGDMSGDLNDLTTGSNAYELNASAVPAFELVSKCEVDQTNTVNVGSGAMLLAAGNANLTAEQNGNAVTNAFGTGKDWLTAVAGSVASLFGRQRRFLGRSYRHRHREHHDHCHRQWHDPARHRQHPVAHDPEGHPGKPDRLHRERPDLLHTGHGKPRQRPDDRAGESGEPGGRLRGRRGCRERL